MAFLIKKCYDICGDNMNNKGFAVSSVLYTLLVAFLMFLGVLLAMINMSNSIILNSNKDLVDDLKLSAMQVKPVDVCSMEESNWNRMWLKPKNDIIIRINTKSGVKYWPKDFRGDDKQIADSAKKDGITVKCIDSIDSSNNTCSNMFEILNAHTSINDVSQQNIEISDISTGESIQIIIGNVCSQ